MYALMLGISQCVGRDVDIFLHGSCQRTYRRPCHGLAYLYDTVEISWAGYGEPCLNDVYAESLKLFRHLNLLYSVQLASRHLLAIAQCGVEDKQSITHIFYVVLLLIIIFLPFRAQNYNYSTRLTNKL